MNTKKMKFFIAMPMFLIGFVLTLTTNVINVKAGNIIDNEAVQIAPPGISLTDADSNTGKKFFDLGTFGNNGAVVGPSTGTNTTRDDLVKMTDGKTSSQLSSVWGNLEDGNYIDTTRKQTLSMWLYFGNTQPLADGMALVFQNGGNDAIAKYNGVPTAGETLGTWGADEKQSTNSELATTAIQNSWALEFDTYINNMGINGNYDVDLGTNSGTTGHIAWAYPGDPATYTRQGSAGAYYYKMNHNDVNKKVPMGANGNAKAGWHHFTLEYDPIPDTNTASIKYYYDDKNYDGTDSTATATGDFVINLDKFHLKDATTGITSTKLRYGFTASSGQQASQNMVVFETMPSVVSANADSKIYDLTQDSNLVDEEYGTVHNGDSMRFDYNLNYEAGEKSLKDVVANINLPNNITYPTDGNIGKVVYANGDSELIPASDVKNGVLNYKLQETLSNAMKGATVQIFGTAKIDNSSGYEKMTVVDSAHATLNGNLYRTSLDTSSFVIVPTTNTLNLDPTNTSTDQYQGTDVKLTGKATYGNDGSPASNLTYYTTIDDGSVIKSGYTGSTDGSYSLTLPYDTYKDKLGVGPHKIKVYAMDKDYIKSDPVTYTVNVLETNPKLSSSNLNLTVPKATGEINMPASLTYDGTYKFDSDNLKWNISVGTGDVKAFDVNSKDNGVTSTDFTQVINASDLGITDSGTYKLNVYVSDQYGRKSNKITYNLNYIAKSVNLIKDDYSFQDVNSSPEAKTVKRKGDWKLAVKTTDSDWKLTAKASQMFMTNDKGEYVDALNGNLVYVDPDGNTQDMSNFVNLGENKNETSDTYDLTKDWKDNSGILLSMMPNPKQGQYKGTIDWVLENSLS